MRTAPDLTVSTPSPCASPRFHICENFAHAAAVTLLSSRVLRQGEPTGGYCFRSRSIPSLRRVR